MASVTHTQAAQQRVKNHCLTVANLHLSAERPVLRRHCAKVRIPACRSDSVVAALAASEVVLHGAADVPHPIPNSTSAGQETLDWHMQWYPVAFLDYLDPKVPYPVELLGERLVLWRDAKQHWRCFEDKCPHRLAPLSEGRIEPSDGTLMCSYHGWRFSGDGQCTDVPQSVDAKANAAACASPRSCAVSRPLKVLQGMVFVWGSSGPNARAESEARPVPGMPDMESTQTTPKRDIDGRSCVNSLPAYMREAPYGWSLMVENLIDPANVPYLYSGVINNRDDPDAAYVRIDAAPGDKPADPAAIAMSGASIRPIVGGISKREWRLDLPTRATAAIVSDKQASSGSPWLQKQYAWCTPTAAGRSTAFVQGFVSMEGSRSGPLIVRLLRYLPVWALHVGVLNATADNNIRMLYKQERNMASDPHSRQHSYFLPAQADRMVAAFYGWLDKRGGGGPPTALKPGAAVLPEVRLEEVLLDRHISHTRHCPYCSGAMKGFQRLQVVAATFGTLCMLAASTLLGGGVEPLSAGPAGLAAGAVLSLVIWWTARRMVQRFVYVSSNTSASKH